MSQYLGDISAYALAVSQGYTGTEEEYAELMASYATVGQTAVTAAQTATAKASEAATSATTATNKASEATTAATTATTKAAEASTSASTATSAKDTAVSASQTATTKATEATTAAATATSAATTATTAKDDAVSAKTAAQTAQTGAETAAASVAESAAQIQTNAEDISQLKSDLTQLAHIDFNITITNGKFANKNSGLESTDASSCVTEFIPVIEGQTYYAEKVYLGSNRAICAYDASKNFLSAIASSTTATEVSFTIPTKCCYIKLTGKADIYPVLNITSGQQIKGTALESAIKYDKNIPFTLEVGKYINQEGNAITGSDYDCTAYIEVVSGYTIGSNKLAPTSTYLIKACFYDSEKRPISYVTGSGLVDGLTFTVPVGAKYLRANKYTGSGASAKMELWYVDTAPYRREFYKADILDAWKDNTEDTLMGLLNVAGKTPIVSICDDDTTVSAIPLLKNLCDTKGIKCTFACVASRLVVGPNAEALTNTLLQYQSEGFHIANHSYSHGDFWKSGTSDFDATECEADLVKAMQTFREKGFIDTDFLVTPFGGSNADEQAIASKWGFNALINSSDYVTNHLWQQGRYKIRRVLLTSANTLDYYKALVDTAYDNGDWLLLETHTDIADQWDSTLVSDVIDYVQAKNISIMPINEAYRIRKPCYDLYAIFKNPI